MLANFFLEQEFACGNGGWNGCKWGVSSNIDLNLQRIFMSLFQIWGQRCKLVGEGYKRSWVQLQVCSGQNIMAVSKCAILNNYCFLCSGCIANIAFALLLIGELVIWIKVRMSLLWCISLYLHWAGILAFESIWECVS